MSLLPVVLDQALHCSLAVLHPNHLASTITANHHPTPPNRSLPPPPCPPQVRGSIPLPWAQRPDSSMLKPEIVLHNFDPLFAATRRHFDQLRWASRRVGAWAVGWLWN